MVSAVVDSHRRYSGPVTVGKKLAVPVMERTDGWVTEKEAGAQSHVMAGDNVWVISTNRGGDTLLSPLTLFQESRIQLHG